MHLTETILYLFTTRLFLKKRNSSNKKEGKSFEFKKQLSSEILKNKVKEINNKRFLFHENDCDRGKKEFEKLSLMLKL